MHTLGSQEMSEGEILNDQLLRKEKIFIVDILGTQEVSKGEILNHQMHQEVADRHGSRY